MHFPLCKTVICPCWVRWGSIWGKRQKKKNKNRFKWKFERWILCETLYTVNQNMSYSESGDVINDLLLTFIPNTIRYLIFVPAAAYQFYFHFIHLFMFRVPEVKKNLTKLLFLLPFTPLRHLYYCSAPVQPVSVFWWSCYKVTFRLWRVRQWVCDWKLLLSISSIINLGVFFQ